MAFLTRLHFTVAQPDLSLIFLASTTGVSNSVTTFLAPLDVFWVLRTSKPASVMMRGSSPLASAEVSTSSPTCSNTNVVRSPFVRVCQPAYCVLLLRVCPRSVGTRQALLQGWRLCSGFVCIANVSDLVRRQS